MFYSSLSLFPSSSDLVFVSLLYSCLQSVFPTSGAPVWIDATFFPENAPHFAFIFSSPVIIALSVGERNPSPHLWQFTFYSSLSGFDSSPQLKLGDSRFNDRCTIVASYMVSPSVRFGRVPPYRTAYANWRKPSFKIFFAAFTSLS